MPKVLKSSLLEMCDSTEEQSSEKRCRLSGRAANVKAEVLLIMECCSALRGDVCGVILDIIGLTPKFFTL